MHAYWQHSLCAAAEVRAQAAVRQESRHPERWKVKMDYAPAENKISAWGDKKRVSFDFFRISSQFICRVTSFSSAHCIHSSIRNSLNPSTVHKCSSNA